MNSIDQRYKVLLQKILDEGVRKQTRNGEVLSIFSHQIRHNMVEGFPLLTTKKMAWKSICTELLWFLKGDTNIKYLVDNDCHIWDGDAYKAYLKWFEDTSKKFEIVREPWTKEQYIEQIKLGNVDSDLSELGPIYGKQWRSWAKFSEKVYTREIREVPEGGRFAETRNVNWVGGSEVVYIDQIANLISELKTNPDSRRLMVNAWNVGELDQMVLPPCHYGFQVYTRELSLEERAKWLQNNKGYDLLVGNLEHDHIREMVETESPARAISLMWNQRSVDTFLGLPFNIASYALLLEIIAKEVNMVPEELIGNLGDVHLYANHIEQAKQQLERQPFKLPKLNIKQTVEFWEGDDESLVLDYYSIDDFELIDYKSHPAIKAPLNN